MGGTEETEEIHKKEDNVIFVLEVFGMVAVLADVGADVDGADDAAGADVDGADDAAADAAERNKRTGRKKKDGHQKRPSPAASLASPRGCQRRPAAGGR